MDSNSEYEVRTMDSYYKLEQSVTKPQTHTANKIVYVVFKLPSLRMTAF